MHQLSILSVVGLYVRFDLYEDRKTPLLIMQAEDSTPGASSSRLCPVTVPAINLYAFGTKSATYLRNCGTVNSYYIPFSGLLILTD
jgi:hypothetical protein